MWLLLVVTAWSASTHAQATGAEALIDRGVAARRAGDDEGALSLFRQAWDTSRSMRARAQMALAEQALGMWNEADTHLREALASSGDPWVESHRAALDGSLREIDARFGTLDVRCAVDGADVRVNGESRGHTPLAAPLRILAGSITVEVISDGHLPLSREVTIVAGQPARETFVLRERPIADPVVTVEPRVVGAPEPAVGIGASAPVVAPPTPSGGSILEEWWFWTLIGTVVVGGGVGTGVGVAASGTTVEPPLVPSSGVVITTLTFP